MKVKTLIKRLQQEVEKNPSVANYTVMMTPLGPGSDTVKTVHVDPGDKSWPKGDWRRYASVDLWGF